MFPGEASGSVKTLTQPSRLGGGLPSRVRQCTNIPVARRERARVRVFELPEASQEDTQ